MTGEQGELRPAYRTLNEPTKLLGLPIGGWAAVIGCGGVAYAWLLVSPLPWRANFSLVAIVLGAPLCLLLLREPAAISPARLLLGALRWRIRPSRVAAPDSERPVRAGGVRLDRAPTTSVDRLPLVELAWRERDEDRGQASA